MANEDYFYAEFKKQREAVPENFLSNEDYEKLITVAELTGQTTIKNIMRVLKETGIRYSSLKDLTVDSVKEGKMTCEGKRKI